MRILVTGACGFVGSTLIRIWRERGARYEILGFDNLSRPGSELNRELLRTLGVRLHHGDLRCASDLDALQGIDAVVDAAANPSVLAGVAGAPSSRQLVEHNVIGTVNVLELCRRLGAAFVQLSTSRVYSIPPLAALPTRVVGGAFEPDVAAALPPGLTAEGVSETFSTTAPVSLYGATKLASEHLALEYGAAFGFPVFVDRCGLLAGAGQFGRGDQGIFSYWIHSWRARRPLRYIGFDGQGHQVRDCLHPADLVPLIDAQLRAGSTSQPQLVNVGGGRPSAMSLRQLSDWCRDRLGEHRVLNDPARRPFDLPWLVLDTRLAAETWAFRPSRTAHEILEDIVLHAERHPDWLALSEAG